MSSKAKKVAKIGKSLVSTVIDPIGVGYGDVVGDAVTGGLANEGIAGAFGGAVVGAAQGVTRPPTERPMPTRDDDAARKAKRRRMALLRQRSGRASTILTSDQDTLG